MKLSILKIIGISFIILLCSSPLFAQKGLFGEEKLAARSGFLLGANGTFDIAAGDMAKRFGNSYRIGASMEYKSKKNYIFGVKFDFMNGDKIKEQGMFQGIADASGNFYSQSGQKISVNKYERGYMAGISAGYIFNTDKKIKDNGIMILTGLGFMQHKILISDRSESITALAGDYKKGYDRLSNGIYLEQYLGYIYLSNNALVNFHIGLNVAVGFTQGRRDFLYDVQKPGNESRTDVLFGVRGGWYLPMFKRKSEEFFFE